MRDEPRKMREQNGDGGRAVIRRTSKDRAGGPCGLYYRGWHSNFPGKERKDDLTRVATVSHGGASMLGKSLHNGNHH